MQPQPGACSGQMQAQPGASFGGSADSLGASYGGQMDGALGNMGQPEPPKGADNSFIPRNISATLLGQGEVDERPILEELDINDRSMGLFRRDSCQRQFCTWVVASPKFDGFIILIILASSICLAIDSPRLDGDSSLAVYLTGLNRFFTAAFACEMLLKMVSFGVCCGRGTRVMSSEVDENGQPKVVRIPPYFRDLWNVLDFFIVMVSLVCLLAEAFPALRPLKALRILRVLRPLRLLARDPGMRLIITALVKVRPTTHPMHTQAPCSFLKLVPSVNEAVGMRLAIPPASSPYGYRSFRCRGLHPLTHMDMVAGDAIGDGGLRRAAGRDDGLRHPEPAALQ